MRKISTIMPAVILALVSTPPLHADDASDLAAVEIITRYNISRVKAKASCSSLGEQIDKVKMMAGISVGVGVVGTVAGGTALATGIIKGIKIKEIDKPGAPEIAENLGAANSSPVNTELAAISGSAVSAIGTVAEDIAPGSGEDKDKQLKDKARMFGTIRTASSFVAGAAGAGAAISSLGSLKTFDDLIENIDACNQLLQEIEKQKTELVFAAPDNPAITEMDKIIKECQGLDSKNINDIKGKMKISGVFSAVGGAAGIAGGITSVVAANKEKQADAPAAPSSVGPTIAEGAGLAAANDTPAAYGQAAGGWNTAATALAGASAVTQLGGTVLSGIALYGLNKNGEIAKNCKEAF